jgi:hypothetical protein
MDSRPALAVVLLIALAGCGAVPFGSGTPGAPAETLTPAPVETEATAGTPTGTPIAAPLPPGVTRNGTVEVDALRDAHGEVVNRTSYTWVLGYEANNSGGGLLNQSFTRRVAVENDRVLARQFDADREQNQTLYVEGDAGYLRVDTPNRTDYESVANPGGHQDYAVGTNAVWRYLAGVDVTVDTVQRDGETYYRLYSADGPHPVSLRGPTSRIADYTVTAYVRPDGLVRTMVVDFVRYVSEREQRISIRFDYDAVGETSVVRPDWVDRVPDDATATPTPTLTSAGNGTATPGEDGTATPDSPTATPTD